MRILDIAQKPPPAVAAEATAQKAARVLRKSRSGALVVTAGGKIAGILSERDIVLRVVGKGLDPHRVRVSRIMSTPVERVAPDASLEDAFDLMKTSHVRHLVVVDAKSRPVRLLSLRKVAEARIESATDQLRSLESFVGAETAGD